MKKLRIVILSLSIFSLFCSAFFNLGFFIHDRAKNLNSELINSIKIPFASNFFLILFIFIVVLIWYLYHRKNRAESITNGLLLLLYTAYLIFFFIGLKELLSIPNELGKDASVWYQFSLAILIAPGMWLAISFIPVLLHFIASVKTGGYDNVGEPDNPYGFIYTILGICYLITLLVICFLVHGLFSSIFEFYENGLIITLIILTFILCAGFRFSSIALDIFNILMNFIFVISWIVILFYNKNYEVVQKYFIAYHLIMVIPMFVLSFFILRHYVLIDRFYKGRTSVYLKK